MTLRRLEVLEKKDRSRDQKELASLQEALVYVRIIVLAYYLGGLQSNERPDEAHARALNYSSKDELFEMGESEFLQRSDDADRRLFAKVGLDLDNTPPSILFEAFVRMVDQLPERWLKWLRSNLQQWYPHVEIAPGSNLPRRLSSDNFLD